MNRYWKVVLLGLVALGCTTSGALIPTPTPVPDVEPAVFHLGYPESIGPLMGALASAYQQYDPSVQIVLVERADQLAWQALLDGDVDLVALTWLPQAASPESHWHTTFARDGLAVIVNPQNGLPGITLDQLRQLFQGQVDDWASWGGLPGTPQVICREEASGDYAFFQQQVMEDARVVLTALVAPSSDAMLDLVQENPLAVGYVSRAWVGDEVRMLTVEGVPPADEAIAAYLYPLSRDVYFMSVGEPQGPVRAFAQWVLDIQGQDIVKRQGFIPVVDVSGLK